MQIKSNDDKLLLNAKIAETHPLDGSLTSIVEYAYELGVKAENKRIKESLLKAINTTEEKILELGKDIPEYYLLFPKEYYAP